MREEEERVLQGQRVGNRGDRGNEGEGGIERGGDSREGEKVAREREMGEN